MTIIRHNRRQFLRGAGGFMLALPFMPSLLPSSAKAQSLRQPRFVAMTTQHGAVKFENMYPSASMLTETRNLYSDHTIKRGALKLSVNGDKASLSPVMTASSAALTESVVSRMNVIQGLDIPWYLGHHTGGYLGNYARTDRETEGVIQSNVVPRPTIDQIMAWSPSFYANLGSTRQRSMHVGGSGHSSMSWGYSNPANKSGEIQPMPTSYSSKELFDSIFVAPTTQVATRVPVVDRVLESYRNMRNGAFGDATRLSKEDRQRLDDHMDRLAELERRVSAVASCGDVAAPSKNVDKTHPGVSYETANFEATKEFYQTFNDVIVTAFICGTSRIATIQTMESWFPYAGSWHQDIAHMALSSDNSQRTITEGHRTAFESLFLDLVNKLNIEEADGKTYLDNTLVMWGQESGFSTHDPVSTPVVTAGGAAGYFSTGNYIDYRRSAGRQWNGLSHTGVLYNQWLANVLQCMGVPREEYALFNDKGYGSNYRESNYTAPGSELWPDRLFDDADKPLPFLVG